MTTRALKLSSAWTRKLKLPAKVKAAQPKSCLEEEFAMQVRAAKLPEPRRQHRFHPIRRWRFDFAFVPQAVAVELQGGTFSNGAHVRGVAYADNRAKSNEAQLMGWLVLECTAEHVRSGAALSWLERALRLN